MNEKTDGDVTVKKSWNNLIVLIWVITSSPAGYEEKLSCIEELKNNNITNNDEVMGKIVATLGALWKQNISHGDTKGTNFLLAHDQVVIIDLDSIKQHKNDRGARRLIQKDVSRFLRNWQDNPHLLKMARTKLKLLGFNP